MEIVERLLADIMLLKPSQHSDEVGELTSWSKKDLAAVGINASFAQDNQSRSNRNVLRGLHYQIQHPQGKLIRALTGTVFDVVVDLRKSSNTFGQFASFEISDKNRLCAWIPPGFAHGFYVTSEYADILYSVTDYRFAEHERTLLWSDPQLGVAWPLLEKEPILSEKDKAGQPFAIINFYE